MTFTSPAADVRTLSSSDVQDRATQAMIDLLGRRPLHELTMEHVAALGGTTMAQLREKFGDLSDRLVCAIQEWNARRVGRVRTNRMQAGTVASLRDLLALSVADPACTRAVMTAAAIAGTPGHPAADA